jgi:hypothetical protein
MLPLAYRRLLFITSMMIIAGIGCSQSTQPSSTLPPPGETDQVRKAYEDCKKAYVANDGQHLWDLLAGESRAAVQQAIEKIKKNYEKAGSKEKLEQEKNLGLTPYQFANLDGPLYLSLSEFRDRYREVMDNDAEKVRVVDDEAEITYTEPDGSKSKIKFLRQDGRWTIVLQIR